MKISILSRCLVNISALISLFFLPRHLIAEPSLTDLMSLAEQGDAEAQYSLAKMYFYGDGVEQNNEEALKWTKKAAEQG